MSIYFLRHIKTKYNAENRISGCFDVEPLTDQSLILPQGETVYFRRVFSSPLKRCRATVDLLPAGAYDNLIFCDQLIERNLGILEGLPKEEAIQNYPHLFCNGKLAVTAEIPKGESITEVAHRISAIAEELKNSPSAANILVCSHNQTLKILYAILKGIPITNEYWKAINFRNGTLVNVEEIKNFEYL